MTIPCTVVVLAPGEVGISYPKVPMVEMKVVPAKWGIKQIAKAQGSTAPDSFRVSCVDGSSVASKKYEFALVLYADKECTTEVSRVAGGCSNDDVVSFPAVSDKLGNFFYSVVASNSTGNSQVLLTDSYIVKKPA